VSPLTDIGLVRSGERPFFSKYGPDRESCLRVVPVIEHKGIRYDVIQTANLTKVRDVDMSSQGKKRVAGVQAIVLTQRSDAFESSTIGLALAKFPMDQE
jgi:hypothetical protein